MTEGVLYLELEIVEGAWHLLGESQPGGEVLAFAERGRAPSIPGPMIRIPIAKDAFDLPSTQRVPQIAQQKVVVGETYDYEYTPRLPGTLRLELRNGGGGLLVSHEGEVVN